MQQEKRLLKVGDRLYKIQPGATIKILEVVEIAKVTRTKAISKCGSYNFNIEMPKTGYTRDISATKWNVTSFILETPELIGMLDRQNKITRLENLDFLELPPECINELVSVLDKYSPLKK